MRLRMFIGAALAAALAASPPAMAAPLAAGSRITAPKKCAHPPGSIVDGSKITFGGTDTYGYYDVVPTPDLPGGHWEIKGQYPKANVFAFQSIGSAFLTQGVIESEDIVPDPGSVNPYLPRKRYKRGRNFYTLRVEFAAPSQRRHPNPPGVLYAGYRMADGPYGMPARSSGGSGVLRSIGGGVPTNDGGVPLPTASWVVDDPAKNIVQNKRQLCAAMYADAQPLQAALALTLDPMQQSTGPQTALLKRVFLPSPINPTSGADGRPPVNVFRPGPRGYSWPFSQVSHYLFTEPNPLFGKFYVIRFKKPTSSRVAEGIPNTGAEQTAYYDWCALQVISAVINTVGKCLGPDELRADKQGYVTLVVSPARERPVIRGKRYANWLLNPASGGMAWMYVLDSNPVTFPQSPYFAPHSLSLSPTVSYLDDFIHGAVKGRELKQFMGEYYPQVFYCTKQKFEAGQCEPPSSG